MKKALAAFLLFIFTFTLCGYVLLFAILQENVSEKMHRIANGDPANLEIIKAPKSEIGKSIVFNDDDEINYHGKLYDIASEKLKGDTIYFYCVNDKEEENLYAGLNINTIQNTEFQSKTQNNHSSPVIKLIVKDYFQPFVKESQNTGCVVKTTIPVFITFSSNLNSSIFIPPPNQRVS